MRPKYIVWLQDDERRIVAHELFFSGSKAKRSFKRATKVDEYGLRELIGETGSYTATDNVEARTRYFGEYIYTSKDRWRQSFLNLDADEEEELSARFRLPVEVIRQVSRMERDMAEKIKILHAPSRRAHCGDG